MAREQVGLFDGLSEGERDRILAEYFSPVTDVRGDISVRNFAWISHGAVNICIRIQRERSKDQLIEVVLDKLEEGTFLNEVVTLWPHDGPTAYPVAAGQCRIRYLRRPDYVLGEATSADVLRNLIREYPQVAMNVIAEMGRRLRRTRRLIPAHPDGRVALYLLEEADQDGLLNTYQSKVDVIKESVGISENAVRKTLSQLEGAGIISRDNYGIITIRDRIALETHLTI